MLPGDGCLGGEDGVCDTSGDPVLHGPQERRVVVGIPVHVCKSGLANHFGFSRHPVQDGDQHGTGHSPIGAEGGVCDATEQAIVAF